MWQSCTDAILFRALFYSYHCSVHVFGMRKHLKDWWEKGRLLQWVLKFRAIDTGIQNLFYFIFFIRFYLREESAIISGQDHFSHVLQPLQTQHVRGQDDLTKGNIGQLTITHGRLLHWMGIVTAVKCAITWASTDIDPTVNATSHWSLVEGPLWLHT